MNNCVKCLRKLLKFVLSALPLVPLVLWLLNVNWFMTLNKILMFFLIILGNISVFILFRSLYIIYSKIKNKYSKIFLDILEDLFIGAGASIIASGIVLSISEPAKLFISLSILFYGFIFIVLHTFYRCKIWRSIR